MLPIVYNWIPANTTYVATLQSLGAAGSMLLNGLAFPFVLGPGNMDEHFPSFNRTITLTSVNNNSGVTFTINGSLEGSPGSVNIAGPNNNTVETAVVFDEITSITTNGAINSVSVGIGQTGSTNWFLVDYHMPTFNLGLQGTVTGVISYTFDVTLDDVNDPALPINIFTPIAAMTAATTNQLANYTTPIRYCRFAITSSTGAATFRGTILQQGLRR